MRNSRFQITAVRDRLYTPVLAPLMQSPWIIAMLGAAAVFQVAVTAMGFTAWPCPLKSTLGVACPGCGLTRAVVLLAQGKWQAAMQLHAFAPVGVSIGMLLATGMLLPARLRQRAVQHLATFEKRSGIIMWLIVGALLYWIGRLITHT